MFTIIGTPEANEKALFLCVFFFFSLLMAKRLLTLSRLYNQLESEKERRVNKETHQQDLQE